MENEKVDEKGLASRVEELERELRMAVVRLRVCAARMRAFNVADEMIDDIEDWRKEAEHLLAGAHAEEKE